MIFPSLHFYLLTRNLDNLDLVRLGKKKSKKSLEIYSMRGVVDIAILVFTKDLVSTKPLVLLKILFPIAHFVKSISKFLS
jgi:hypothetical protein